MIATRTLLDSLDGIALLLDRDLRVLAAGMGNWRRFWAENDGPDRAPPLIGHDVTQFFTRGPVRSAFRVALDGVATGARPALRLPFRCDSPLVRRDMHLVVSRCGGDLLLYQTRLLAVRRWAEPLAAVGARRCAVCGRAHPGAAGASTADPLDWVDPPGPAPLPAQLCAAEGELCPRCALALLGSG